MSGMRFDEIVFVDNFFRSPDNALPSYPANRQFLFKAFGLPAGRLGLQCREVHARSEGGTLDVGAMMDALALPRSAAGWARTCAADLAPLLDAGLLPRLAPRQLVIGWGMPPSLMHWVDRQGASFIDIEISPVRFASHLAFCARTNDRQIEAVLAGWRIDEEAFWNEATATHGYFSRRSASQLFHRGLRVGLFCGQSAIDLALVRDGRIARPIEVLDPVRELARSVDLLVIKPHPYEPDLRHLAELAAPIPNTAWTDANIYALLCADNVEFVCGLSSGALHEATYFMKPAVHLIASDRNSRGHLPASCSDWMPVGPGIMSLEALAGIVAGASDMPPRASRFPDDALDRAFALRWGRDAQNPGLVTPPVPTLGAVHDLRAAGPARNWLSFGWRTIDGVGVLTAGERACVVIPLEAGSLAGASFLHAHVEGLLSAPAAARRPLVRAWIDGHRADVQAMPGGGVRAKVRLDLSIRLNADPAPRVLVLEFEMAGDGRASFELQRLGVRPTASPAASAAMPSAASAIAVMAALIFLGVFSSALLRASSADPEAEVTGAAQWTQIKSTLTTPVEWVRDDLHLLLRQHRG
ncbi:hypothetical protein [Variovorax sp. PBL-E5]|uniref:hypothetical protein n=1 Tax=Variovorax sp. PBL-E5 TaxID=434014 RepID=UPI001318348A|nr:hypothetical protein [Variovorax sp. PBL-E5]VTU18870.1 hypothetical protein E5CHR_00674 [Variovorax sp. PBL-E5]